MNYDLLYEMIQSLEQFEKESSGNVSMNDFRNWLNEKAYLAESPKHLTQKHDMQVNEMENDICKQVIMLGRYAKLTIRKGLEDYPELVNEDFTYLYRLMDYEFLTKMQLIEKNAHEKQTGLEIIKRLVRNGLIKESPDPNDGRSKRISVTAKGRNLFKKSMEDVTLTSKVLGGNLELAEKENLLEILKKLNQFHEVVYLNHRESKMEEIEQMV